MTRRVVALLVAGVTAWVLAADALGPFVNSGGALSASAMRAALDGRVEALADVREQVIDIRRAQVALRDRVFFLEQSVAMTSTADVAAAPLAATAVDPWTEAGIVAGQVANAEALNEVFARFVTDATNIRAFQTLLIRDQEALDTRIGSLETMAAILDPPTLGPLAPNEDEVSVPHTFETGSPIRANEMNANLQAVDAAFVAEAGMAAAIAVRQAVLEARIVALEAEIDPQPLFTWRIGTYEWASGVSTESHFIFLDLGTFEPFTITVTGPEAYERSTTVASANAGSTGWFDALLPSGTYTATTTYGGRDFSLPIEYDATRRLSRPDVTLDAATTSTVDVTIGRVEEAAVYDVRLQGVDVAFQRRMVVDPFAEPSRAVQFTGLDLDPTESYRVHALTASVVDPWSPTMPPQQVDRGVSMAPVFEPTAP